MTLMGEKQSISFMLPFLSLERDGVNDGGDCADIIEFKSKN